MQSTFNLTMEEYFTLEINCEDFKVTSGDSNWITPSNSSTYHKKNKRGKPTSEYIEQVKTLDSIQYTATTQNKVVSIVATCSL